MKTPKQTFSLRLSERHKAFIQKQADELDLSVAAWFGRLIDREMADAADRDAPARKKAGKSAEISRK